MYYFAYASCMDAKSFSLSVTRHQYEFLGAAILRDFKLVFNLYSKRRRGGVADIVPWPGEYVEGVLYRLKPEAFRALDEREGVPIHLYKRMGVTVDCGAQKIEAITYTVVNKSKDEIIPHPTYLQLIYNGAAEHLSFAYQKKLTKVWATRFGIKL